MNQYIIRKAFINDAVQIRDIYSYYCLYTAITFEYNVPSLKEMEKRIVQTLEKYPYIVAVSDNKIIGYAYAGMFKERDVYNWSVEASIYVNHKFRHNGVGKTLYQRLEALCLKIHIINMNACISSPIVPNQYLDNSSIDFHVSMGYKTVGEFHQIGYKFDQWYNMIWMEKFIADHNKPLPVRLFSSLNKKDLEMCGVEINEFY